MTHESKLALIIGFALLLLVGVVVSDHFSPQTRESPADLAEEQSQVAAPLPGLENRVSLNRPRTQGSAQQPADDQSAQQQAIAQQPVAQQAATTRAGGSGEAGLESMFTPVPSQPLIRIDQSAGQIELDGSFRPPLLAAGTPREPGEGWREPEQRRMAPLPAPEVAEQARWHIVREGDTLFAIATLHYGSGERWPLIRDANNLAGGVIVPGQRLKIPQSQRPVAGTTSLRLPPPARSGGPRTYEVKPGDTLSEIAMRELGSVRHMAKLLEANRDKLGSADEIRVGMRLTLPEI